MLTVKATNQGSSQVYVRVSDFCAILNVRKKFRLFYIVFIWASIKFNSFVKAREIIVLDTNDFRI